MGSIKQRGDVLEFLGRLSMFPDLAHDEVLALVEGKRLWEQGLSSVDARLLGSVSLVPGAKFWTRDKRLAAVGLDAGVALLAER